MITLSFSTINNCLQPHNSHCWINRVTGRKPEDKAIYQEGKLVHDIIQRHVSSKERHKDLEHLDLRFPIVEETERDPRCKFEVSGAFKGYSVIGFVDGLDHKNKRFLEIKSSSSPWSLGKFQKSFQRKLYAWAFEEMEEAVLVTCQRDPALWSKEKPKVYTVPITKKDREDAVEFIWEGIDVINKGDFTGGLSEDGYCDDPWCYYGNECQFKR